MTSLPMDLSHWLTLRVRLEPVHLVPGGRGKLVLEIEIPDGGHIEAHEPPEPFLIPTVLNLEPVEGVTFGPVRYPPTEDRRFDWSPAVLQVYHGTVRCEMPIEVAADAVTGPRRIRGQLRYQGCTPNACLPPNTQPVEAALKVGSA